MPDIAIDIQNLGKRYRLGGTKALGRTFGEMLYDRIARLYRPDDQTDRSAQYFWALRDINLQVERGEVLGVIGSNGAGKSTLLKILSRITDPTEGWAGIHGRLASLLEVGTGFHPELSGRENIYLNGTILGMRKREIDQQFDQIVEFSGISRFLETPVKRYSSGMRVRLAFAVAAHLHPEILVIDEVLAVGDAAFQKRCLGKMKDVATSGRTVLFVSHNMDAVRTLCHRAAWLVEGRVHQYGQATDVVHHYLSRNMTAENQPIWEPIKSDTSDESNQSVCLNRVTLMNRGSQRLALFYTDEPITLDIDLTIRRTLPNARVGFFVSRDDGMILFESYQTAGPSGDSVWYPGRYRFMATIPGSLLAPGHLLFSINVDIHRVRYLGLYEHILSAEIIPPQGKGGIYAMKKRGVVDPKVSWKTEHESSKRPTQVA